MAQRCQVRAKAKTPESVIQIEYRHPVSTPVKG